MSRGGIAVMQACMLATGVLATHMSALAQTPQTYKEAKAAADRDEASLNAGQRAMFGQAQSRQLDTAVTDCASPNPDTSPFVVVAELDARGKIVRTWRQGDTALAQCVERELNGRFLEAPPRAPFHVSFELSFTR